MTDYAELVSLVLTWPTVVLGIGVLCYWGREALEVCKTPVSERTDVQWLVLGVAVAFLGEVLDNTYWGIAWTAEYIQHPSRDFWFSMGAWPNIPFRQLAGIYAAYCHVYSFYVATKQGHARLKQLVVLSLLIGLLYVAVCTWIRM